MKLYNTLSRQVEDLKPQNHLVRIYVCGVTVYDNSHIGHARTIIIFDVLRRYLLSRGYKVVFVQNFTDVDDKIINRAKAEGKKAEEISLRYIDRYFNDFDSLNVMRADYYPKATDHIKEMIQLIDGLIKKGHAYLTLNGVYFKVMSFPGYGKLSRKSIEELESGARIEIDPSKENPLDFAVWKFYSDETVWPSPWGNGRPGWHIECSAMSRKYLGDTLEIHGGGHDLVFPHHENEIAQSESYTGKQLAKIWVHTGMVTINSQKMSKSLGNIITIEQALKTWRENPLRLYCLSAHYSKPLDYTDELLEESIQRWRQIETCVYELHFAVGSGGEIDTVKSICNESIRAFEAAMDDDMNTSLAVAELMRIITKLNRYIAAEKLTKDMADNALPTLNKIMGILGLKIAERDEKQSEAIEYMVLRRNELRAEKKFKQADELRKKLVELLPIDLLDHKGRTVWVNSKKTRMWNVINPEDQVHEANRKLETRLMQIVSQRNLNVHLHKDRSSSIKELVDILINEGVIPPEGRSREFADTITKLGDKAARGEQITIEEFEDGDYTLAIAWFEMILDDINEQEQ
ncbi:MAG: cysteine--tRNA ligase [Nitrososphaera sp.]